MSDLVDRLRRGSGVFKELGEAADEIERLRERLDAAHKVRDYSEAELKAEIEILRAEIERLKDELQSPLDEG
jgi:predicted RNase H-like nuclease (RuvC/YqgF family)